MAALARRRTRRHAPTTASPRDGDPPRGPSRVPRQPQPAPRALYGTRARTSGGCRGGAVRSRAALSARQVVEPASCGWLEVRPLNCGREDDDGVKRASDRGLPARVLVSAHVCSHLRERARYIARVGIRHSRQKNPMGMWRRVQRTYPHIASELSGEFFARNVYRALARAKRRARDRARD